MRFTIAALAVTAVTLTATPALAGPPFICHAFELSDDVGMFMRWGTCDASQSRDGRRVAQVRGGQSLSVRVDTSISSPSSPTFSAISIGRQQTAQSSI